MLADLPAATQRPEELEFTHVPGPDGTAGAHSPAGSIPYKSNSPPQSRFVRSRSDRSAPTKTR